MKTTPRNSIAKQAGNNKKFAALPQEHQEYQVLVSFSHRLALHIENVLFTWKNALLILATVMWITWGIGVYTQSRSVITFIGVIHILIALFASFPLFWVMYRNSNRVRAITSFSYLLFYAGSTMYLCQYNMNVYQTMLAQAVMVAAFMFGTGSAISELTRYMHKSVTQGKTEQLFGYYLDLLTLFVTVFSFLITLVARPIFVQDSHYWGPLFVIAGQTLFLVMMFHRWYVQRVIRWPLIALTVTLLGNMIAYGLLTFSVTTSHSIGILDVIFINGLIPLFIVMIASQYSWYVRDSEVLPRESNQQSTLILIVLATTVTMITFYTMPLTTTRWWSIAPVILVIIMLIRLVSLTGARDKARSHLAALQQQIDKRTNYDVTTDLLNRRGVEQWLNQYFKNEQIDIGLIFIKINGIRNVNDVGGYITGDQALYFLGQRLTHATPQTDLVGRMDGNIFVIALTNANDIGAVEFFARQLIDLVTQPIVSEGRVNSFLSANAYVVLANEQDKVSELLSIADAAVNQLFTQEDSSVVKMHTRILSDVVNEFSDIQRLRTALEKSEFELFFQPVIDLQNGRPTGFEALARWTANNVSPSVFIPQIENAGLADMFGRWVLNESTSWAAQHGTDIAINISPRHLHNPSFFADVCQAIETSGCPAERMVLEITERTSIQNEEALMKTLANIRSLGVRIAVDDFGTGEFSLVQLSQLPLDIIKIDRSFVQTINHQVQDRAMIESLIHIANGLGLSIIAEGIESFEVADALGDLLCEEAQGYLWAKPMSADQAAKWWRANKHNVVVSK